MDYLVTDPARTIALSSLAEGRWHLAAGPVLDLRRTFIDTFDWAVYRAGATLQWRHTPRHARLIWNGLSAPDGDLAQRAPTAPGFAADLPPGPVRKRLLRITQHRRLLPVMRIETRTHSLLMQDADHQTVARLRLAQSRFHDPRGGDGDLDCEFLHDLRVATRRTRSALGQIRGVFPAPLAAHFKAEFAWLQEVTGPVRDLDVYLLEFDAYQRALPPALRPDLEPLRTMIEQLKVLLDNLGGFQDRAVQAAHLRDLAQRMRDEDQAASNTLLAVGAVVGNLLSRQQQARGEFDQVFDAFLDGQRQPRREHLFNPAPADGEATLATSG
ncbi:CHAD domain-containing protein [Candidatus Thiodictyon syntrophicum]|nr:CHAD domain-containing protein [Candidatus Thiodictyon syntrophicum]